MQPKPITRYGLYYSYSNVPFDNCDADWRYYTSYETLEIAEEQRDILSRDSQGGYWQEYYIIMEEVTERKIVYTEIEDVSNLSS